MTESGTLRCQNCRRVFPGITREDVNKMCKYTNPYVSCTCPDCGGRVEFELPNKARIEKFDSESK